MISNQSLCRTREVKSRDQEPSDRHTGGLGAGRQPPSSHRQAPANPFLPSSESRSLILVTQKSVLTFFIWLGSYTEEKENTNKQQIPNTNKPEPGRESAGQDHGCLSGSPGGEKGWSESQRRWVVDSVPLTEAKGHRSRESCRGHCGDGRHAPGTSGGSSPSRASSRHNLLISNVTLNCLGGKCSTT